DAAALVETMPLPTAKRAKLAAEHRLPDVPIASALAVEALLAAVVDARNAERGRVERERVQRQRRPLTIGAEPRLLVALPHLVVVVVERHHLVLEPDVRVLLDEERVAEQIEVGGGLPVALDQILELVRDVVDAERGIDAGDFQRPIRAVTAAGDLADQVEAVLAETLGELVDHRGQVSGGAEIH